MRVPGVFSQTSQLGKAPALRLPAVRAWKDLLEEMLQFNGSDVMRGGRKGDPVQLAIHLQKIDVAPVAAKGRRFRTDEVHETVEGVRKEKAFPLDPLLGDAGEIGKIIAEDRMADWLDVTAKGGQFAMVSAVCLDGADLDNLGKFVLTLPQPGDRARPGREFHVENDQRAERWQGMGVQFGACNKAIPPRDLAESLRLGKVAHAFDRQIGKTVS